MVSTKQAVKWLNKWQARLFMQAWEISCVWVDAKTIPAPDDDPNLECYGTIHADPARWFATMTLALDRTPAEVEETILHECLHLLLVEWTGTVSVARTYVPAALYNVIEEQRADAEERTVELLTRALWNVGRRADVSTR